MIQEFDVLKRHPVVGEQICRTMRSFREIVPIIRHHHEKLKRVIPAIFEAFRELVGEGGFALTDQESRIDGDLATCGTS